MMRKPSLITFFASIFRSFSTVSKINGYEEARQREQRIFTEADSGLIAASTSGRPLAKLTTSLNKQTIEYFLPVLKMPEMGGLEVLRRAREILPGFPGITRSALLYRSQKYGINL